MERSRSNAKGRKRKVSAILTSDWHIREDIPVCRSEEFIEAQWQKIQFIKELQVFHNCDVLHAGDLFDYWKPSPELLSKTIEHIPAQFYTVYGNHDLPQHNIGLAYKSGVYTLVTGGIIGLLSAGHYGTEELCIIKHLSRHYKVGVTHTYTYTNKLPYPGCLAATGSNLLAKHKDVDLLLTGDNHQSFVVQVGNRLLVNPGSIMRQTADQIYFKPCVYLWYGDTNTIERVYLPIKKGVISVEHLEKVEEKLLRLEAFMEGLTGEWEIGISFEQNLKKFFNSNKVYPKVKELVYKAIQEV